MTKLEACIAVALSRHSSIAGEQEKHINKLARDGRTIKSMKGITTGQARTSKDTRVYKSPPATPASARTRSVQFWDVCLYSSKICGTMRYVMYNTHVFVYTYAAYAAMLDTRRKSISGAHPSTSQAAKKSISFCDLSWFQHRNTAISGLLQL